MATVCGNGVLEESGAVVATGVASTGGHKAGQGTGSRGSLDGDGRHTCRHNDRHRPARGKEKDKDTDWNENFKSGFHFSPFMNSNWMIWRSKGRSFKGSRI